MQRRSSLALFALVAVFAVQAESSGPALAVDAKDARLQWGPCPEFMPAGCLLAVLHGDPAQPNADVLLKVPANATIG